MHVAIGICTLVLGGVTLPSDTAATPGPGVPIFQQPRMELGPDTGGSWDDSTRTPAPVPPGDVELPPRYGPSPGGYGQPPGGYRPAPQGPRPTPPQGGGRATTREPRAVPFAPTDPDAASESFPWGPPTANAPLDLRGLGQQESGGGRPTLPAGRQMPSGRRSGFSGGRGPASGAYSRPSARRPAYQRYTSLAPRGSATSDSITSHRAVLARQAAVTKPFSDYTPGSGLSPYLELFRLDTITGADNYNTLVRPLLNQQMMNRQVGSQIRGLQNTTRSQGAAIQNLGRENRFLKGISTPQYYMNFGDYYPSVGR